MSRTVIAFLLTLCTTHAELATIVFWSDTAGPSPSDVFEVAVDGSSVQNITEGRHPSAYCPSVARDGGSIAYVAPAENGYTQIWEDTRGQGYRQLTTTPAFSAHPSWSPDADQVVFRSDTDRTAEDLPDNLCLSGQSPHTFYLGCNDLFVLNLKTGESTNITADPVFDVLPAWSPSGQRIAYLRMEGRPRGNIWIWENGLNTQITEAGDFISTPSWSPDGRFLAVGATRGKQVIVILDDAGNQVGEPTSSFDYVTEPAWSNDGSAIAFYVWKSEGGAIWQMNPDGSNAAKVIDWADGAKSMSWTPGEIPITAVLPLSGGSLKEILQGRVDPR